jgi:hypothetical protein
MATKLRAAGWTVAPPEQRNADYDAKRYGPTGHPIDPMECVNALGDRCTPQDCVLDHMQEVPGTVTMPLAPELVAIDELCDARNGDLKCILSKGHTKPVDHWNGTFGFADQETK